MSRIFRLSVLLALALITLALIMSACSPESEASEHDFALTQSPTPSPSPSPELTLTVRPDAGQEELDDLLREAAWANEVTVAEELIRRGADVNAKDDTVQSAYLIATSEGHLEFLRLTLRHGADMSALDWWDGTGLIRAAERGHVAVVGELVRAGTDLDHVNRPGYQAIHEAVWLGRDDPTYHATVRVLVAAGADYDTPSVNQQLTPLQMARAKGFSEQAAILEVLTTSPAPEYPTAALLSAASLGDADGVALAVRAGAAPDARDEDGRSARDLALASGGLAAAQILEALGG